MILVTGYVDLDPRHAEAFRGDMEQMSPGRRVDSGCMFYSVTVADPVVGRMLVVELWGSQEALTAHLQSPKTSAFLHEWSGRMQGDVRIYDALTERSLLE